MTSADLTPWRAIPRTQDAYLSQGDPWSDSMVRQAGHLVRLPVALLRVLWDEYDGTNAPDGWDGEAIHLALNMAGDGAYCAV